MGKELKLILLSLKVISFGYNFFHLAKVLATTNSEPELAPYYVGKSCSIREF